MPHGENEFAMMIFWDFAAAFPSRIHEWVWKVLTAMTILRGFINVAMALYHGCSATASTGGSRAALFWVLSGVLQGCPLSGMLFALCMNPFLIMMISGADDL